MVTGGKDFRCDDDVAAERQQQPKLATMELTSSLALPTQNITSQLMPTDVGQVGLCDEMAERTTSESDVSKKRGDGEKRKAA